MREYIFPVILIVLQLGAGIMCAIDKNIRMSVYWIAAAILNICVTF